MHAKKNSSNKPHQKIPLNIPKGRSVKPASNKKSLQPDDIFKKNPKCQKCKSETAVYFVAFSTQESGIYNYGFTCVACSKDASKPHIVIKKFFESPRFIAGTLLHAEETDVDWVKFMDMFTKFCSETDSYKYIAYE